MILNSFDIMYKYIFQHFVVLLFLIFLMILCDMRNIIKYLVGDFALYNNQLYHYDIFKSNMITITNFTCRVI